MQKSIKVLDLGEVALLDHMGNDSAIANAARISYSKGTKQVSDDEALIRYLLRHSHTTPFEQVVFQFYIKAPIFVIRQWHRHRTWSYNEVSGRYSELPEECYVPDVKDVSYQSKTNKQGSSDTVMDGADEHITSFISEQKAIHSQYAERIASGMRKELARINLPLSQYTEMVARVDLHNLFHFLKLRMDSHAQYEIRVFAEAMYELIKDIVPLACKAFEDYKRNAKTLSAAEQTVLCDLVNTPKNSFITPCREIYNGSYGLTKREWFEFFDWLDNLKGRYTLSGNVIIEIPENEKKGNP